MIRIRTVDAIGGFRVRLGFTDGSVGEVDLAPYLKGEVFRPLVEDPALFAGVRVDRECQTIVWLNRADMDPDVLYELAHTGEATRAGRS